MNYPFYNQNFYTDYRQSFSPQFPPQNTMQVTSRFVTNVEEAKAAMIDPLSFNLYLDSGNGKIYLKKLGNNGLSEFISYSADETKSQLNPMEEINKRLSNIENYLGELKNDKSVSNDTKSNADTTATIQQSNATVAEEQSTGFSKNAGNDKWKKR